MGNGTSSDGWSLEDGYPDTAKKDVLPRRAKYSGFTGSQVLVLKDFEQDLDYSCKGPVQGFKVRKVDWTRLFFLLVVWVKFITSFL